MGTETTGEPRKSVIHVALGGELHAAAIQRARLEDRSTASLVRRALRELLERDEQKKAERAVEWLSGREAERTQGSGQRRNAPEDAAR